MSGEHGHSRSAGPSGVESIARWFLDIDAASLPVACLDQAKLLLLDTLGCAIAGQAEDVCASVVSHCLDVAGAGACTIVGRATRVDLAQAVLANGVLARALDLNDYVISVGKKGPQIGGHPSDNIPVALAAGEAAGRSGRDILAAIAIGYELFGRLKGMMDRKGPWDGVSLSAFVAAAMAGRLLGLDAGRLAHALALAGSRAATPAIVRHGGISAAKSIANAMVARGAMEATQLAARGVTGPLAILEHARGLRGLFPNGEVAEIMSAAFPQDNYIMRANVKMYPCLATGQAAVAAALALRPAVRDALDDIAAIDIVMADYSFVREQQEDPGRVRPRSRESADHSFQFLVAVSLIDGAFGPAQFDNERWFDPRVVALMERMSTSVDAGLNDRAPGGYPCRVRARMTGGGEHSAEVLHPPGYSRGGITEREVVEKFHSVANAFPRERRERIVAEALGLDRAANAGALGEAVRG